MLPLLDALLEEVPWELCYIQAREASVVNIMPTLAST